MYKQTVLFTTISQHNALHSVVIFIRGISESIDNGKGTERQRE